MFRCVMSLHGIRTRGVWQKDLVPVLARHGFIPYALDYGAFSTVQFASGRARAGKVEWLRGEYERVTAEAGVRRPSIVAHSLGTYLVAKLLVKYPELVFDKIIFAGSIVERDFDWARRLRAGQVNVVRNDYGLLDRWPGLARWLVPDSGPSGAMGFSAEHPDLVQQCFPQHGHSDYFHRQHFQQYWIPTLMRVRVGAAQRGELTSILDITCQSVAARLGVAARLIRANIFVPDETGTLRIPPGLAHNIETEAEQSVAIAPGTGCTGVAFQGRTQTVAIMQQDWGRHTLPGSDLARLDPRLRWVVSTPIPDPDIAGGVLGIFNVDGLEVDRSRADLAPLLPDLLAAAELLAVTFRRLT